MTNKAERETLGELTATPICFSHLIFYALGKRNASMDLLHNFNSMQRDCNTHFPVLFTYTVPF